MTVYQAIDYADHLDKVYGYSLIRADSLRLRVHRDEP